MTARLSLPDWAARVRIIARPPRTVSQNFLPTRACPRLGAPRRLHVTFSAHKEAGVGGMRGGEDEEEGGGGGGGIFFTTTSADAAD